MNHSALGRVTPGTALGWSLVTSSLAPTLSLAPTEPISRTPRREASAEIVVLPKPVPDPIEPVNRVVYSLNKGIMTMAVKPTAKVYRLILIKSVRTGIGNFGRNITFPGRMINSLAEPPRGGVTAW